MGAEADLATVPQVPSLKQAFLLFAHQGPAAFLERQTRSHDVARLGLPLLVAARSELLI